MSEFCTLNAAAVLISEVVDVSKTAVLQLACAGLLGPVLTVGRNRVVEAIIVRDLTERGGVGDAELARTVEALGPLFVIRHTVRHPLSGMTRDADQHQFPATGGPRHDMAVHAWHVLSESARTSMEERFGAGGFVPLVTTVGGYVVGCHEGVGLIPGADRNDYRFAVRPAGAWGREFERRWMPTPPGGGRWLWWPSQPSGQASRAVPSPRHRMQPPRALRRPKPGHTTADRAGRSPR
ncbi:MAG: hypothetical protein HOV66_03010 [Streptomycetaceae bacterium]|nr:hypothetical protein [Streptomycetaceae bacterium]